MKFEIETKQVAVTTTGNDASATGNGNTGGLHGFLLDVYLDYHASAPASTDVTVSYLTQGGNILVVTDNKTDGLYTPRVEPVDNTNTVITNAHDRFPLDQAVKVAVAGSNALTACVTAYIRYLKIC